MRFELSHPMRAGEIATVLKTICPIDADTVISALTTDSRLTRPGDLFVALRGRSLDGHLFLKDAKQKGAALLLAEKEGDGMLSVANTARALGEIAAYSLQKHRIPVVAITGSVGKTGTKEAVAAALGAQLRVHKTAENENNELGVAYTLLSRKKDDEVMVLEFGTSSKGEIAGHAHIAPPSVAIITAIGSAHIGAFGSREAILAEKADIYKEMQDGLLLLNGDDAYLRALSPKIPVRYIGTGSDCNPSARKVFFSRYGISYTMAAKNGERHIFLRGIGRPKIYASLFALAAADHFGIKEDLAADALFRMPPTDGRQRLWNIGGILLIDDAYNASPESMEEALYLLSSLPTAGQRYAVIGDMLELGEMSEALHRKLGMQAARGADRLFYFGKYAQAVEDGAKEAGMPADRIALFPDADGCLAALRPCLSDGDTVLVKASHALNGTEIVNGLRTLEQRS